VFAIEMNVGQVCVAGSRILVQEGIADEFTKEFTALMSKIKVGDPFDPTSTQGPLNSAPHFDRVRGWVKTACDDGATLAIGGKDLQKENGGGYYISPTVFTNVKKDNRVLANEVFGPVVSIQTFKDEAEAIAEANRTTYGLASAVFTSNHERMLRMNEAIRAGTGMSTLKNELLTSSLEQPLQLHLVRRPVRWIQAVGHRPRVRRGGAVQLPRDQGCYLQHGPHPLPHVCVRVPRAASKRNRMWEVTECTSQQYAGRIMCRNRRFGWLAQDS